MLDQITLSSLILWTVSFQMARVKDLKPICQHVGIQKPSRPQREPTCFALASCWSCRFQVVCFPSPGCPTRMRFLVEYGLKDRQGVSEGCAEFGMSIYNRDRCFCKQYIFRKGVFFSIQWCIYNFDRQIFQKVIIFYWFFSVLFFEQRYLSYCSCYQNDFFCVSS